MLDHFTTGVRLDSEGRYTIVLGGELDLVARPPARELVNACVEAGATHIRFDMRDVTMCGSDCAWIVLTALRLGVATTVVPSKCVKRMLDICNLGTFLTLEDP